MWGVGKVDGRFGDPWVVVWGGGGVRRFAVEREREMVWGVFYGVSVGRSALC